MQQLTRVEWDVPWRGAGDSHQHTITSLVNALRTLSEPGPDGRGGTARRTPVWQDDRASWSLRGPTTTEGLHSPQSSRAWFRGLSPPLRQLTVLQALVISGDSKMRLTSV
jgi:hypothetical protein